MGRVRVLPEDVKNQIAAGEVVERPASVVKELVENALDAGARRIKIEVLGGGVEFLRVEDDGHGMTPEDARLALVRHATSKLREARDLERMETLGFRGEALPAIASVSRFTLRTATREGAEGLELRVEGGAAAVESSAPAVEGTAIEVADLFFNTPARRKFLKRPATELGHIGDVVTRLALAHPEVGFNLRAEGRSVVDAPGLEADAAPESVRARLRRLLGQASAEGLFSLPAERLARAVRVEGWVGRPPLSERGPRGLHLFVNGRFVRERTLSQAVQEAYRGRLPKGRQPVVVLFVDLDPRDVDVNVHPQKTEVRFARPGEVFRAVQTRLRRGLAEMGVEAPVPEKDPEDRRRAVTLAAEAEEVAPTPAYRGHARRLREAFGAAPGAGAPKRIARWLEPRPEEREGGGEAPQPKLRDHRTRAAPSEGAFGAPAASAPPPGPSASAPLPGPDESASWARDRARDTQLGLELPRMALSAARRIGVALGRWAVLEGQGAMWLVDLHAVRAHLQAEGALDLGPSQPLLVPEPVAVRDGAQIVAEYGEALAAAGFSVEVRDGELLLLAAPEGAGEGSLAALLDVAIAAAREERPIEAAVRTELRAQLRPAEGAGPVREEEVGPLLEALERSDGPRASKLVVALSARQIAQLFGARL